ncbi:MAG: hypothetical protein ABL908_01630 [Hyphomicrobium sp.]
MRMTSAICIAAVMALGSAGSVAAMCGGDMMGGGQAASAAGRSQCSGSMTMGGMMGKTTAPRTAGEGSKSDADAHAGMDMSGNSKGGMGGMMMAAGCCCSGNRALGARSGGMCGGGGSAMDRQEDHTKDPLLTDPMWDEKPGTAPHEPPSQAK